MIITAISDLHGHLPSLPGGDLLIVAGDITASDKIPQWAKFFDWFTCQDYEKKILIGGNHDGFLEQCLPSKHPISRQLAEDDFFEYLQDSGTEYQGLKIWGCPHSLWFSRINPICAAFTGSEEDLKKKYDLIPNDIDILISHSPAFGILDENANGEHCGSKSLLEAVNRIRPQLLIHGHIHEQGSKIKRVYL